MLVSGFRASGLGICLDWQVYRLHTRLPGGKAHDKEIRILVNTWAARKLSEATLLRIVKEVFGATIA